MGGNPSVSLGSRPAHATVSDILKQLIRDAKSVSLGRLAGVHLNGTGQLSGGRSTRGHARPILCILAEFFFSLRALGLDDPKAMIRYVEAHNAEIKREVETNPLCRDSRANDGLTRYGRRLREFEFSQGEMKSIGDSYFDNDD